MTVHTVPRARGRSLLDSLAALGLLRVLGTQADPAARSWVVGTELKIDTSVEDLTTWLTTTYVPTPVMNPWNEGSGFGEKDKASKDAMKALLENLDPRLDPFRTTYEIVAPLAARFRSEGWDKRRLVTELRAVCPEVLLPWLDATVVVAGDRLIFPPLLGSGGNDGRLDFSTNYHQRVIDIMRPSALTLVSDWLAGHSQAALSRGAVGQFDPGGAGTPNSSPFGAADSIVNPWTFVLMVEGSMMFASAPARRLDTAAVDNSRAAMTFSTSGTAVATATGSSAEDTRGEIWVPWWEQPLTYPAVRRMFRDGRAVWRGKTVTQAAQMYLATATRGVAAGIAGFDRYSLVKRNGLAYSAVLTDSARTTTNALLQLVERTEDWPQRVMRSTNLSRAVELAAERFETARIEFARGSSAPTMELLRRYLAAIVSLEIAVGRSGSAKSNLTPRPVGRGTGRLLLDLLPSPSLAGLEADRGFRIALGLASMRTLPVRDAPRGRLLRQIVLPLDPSDAGDVWRDAPVVRGYGTRDLIDVLADVAAWHAVAVTRDLPGARSNQENRNRSLALRGVTGPTGIIQVRAADLHALAGGTDAADWTLALLALDWTGTRWYPPPAPVNPIDPLLAALSGLRRGIGAVDVGAADIPDSTSDVERYGMRAEWLTQLRAGQVERVHRDATAQLRQIGRDLVEFVGPPVDHDRGRRIAAALLPFCRDWRGPFSRVTHAVRESETGLSEPMTAEPPDNDPEETP